MLWSYPNTLQNELDPMSYNAHDPNGIKSAAKVESPKPKRS